MYTIRVSAHFSSAHKLRGYRGKCEELHGHNWKVEVTVKKAELDKVGMVLDFKYVKHKLNGILQALDHKYLNTIAAFKKTNPTSEGIARYIFGRLKQTFGTSLVSVTVWENQASCATYEE